MTKDSDENDLKKTIVGEMEQLDFGVEFKFNETNSERDLTGLMDRKKLTNQFVLRAAQEIQ